VRYLNLFKRVLTNPRVRVLFQKKNGRRPFPSDFPLLRVSDLREGSGIDRAQGTSGWWHVMMIELGFKG
jgi:hypothetical protein